MTSDAKIACVVNTPITSFRQLDVWLRANELRNECYRIASQMPAHERYGLAGQLRRAAMSVPANIAEGHGRGGTREFLQFLAVARGSLMETESHLVAAEQLGYASAEELVHALSLRTSVAQLLNALIRALRKRVGQRSGS